MIKSLFKLAIAFLIAHALFRFVPPYASHTQFKQELEQRALTWREHSDDEVRDLVLIMAGDHAVPIGGEHVTVRRERDRLFVDVAYTRGIEFVPGWTYAWPFEADVAAWIIRPQVPIR